MAARVVVPSQYLRKLAAYPRRNTLARAWQEETAGSKKIRQLNFRRSGKH